MNVTDFKKALLDTGHHEHTLAFIEQHAEYIAENGYSTSMACTLFYNIDRTFFKVVYINNCSMLISNRDEYWELMGLPIGDKANVREVLSLCLELGVGFDLSKEDASKIGISKKTEIIMDGYTYNIEDFKKYFNECSRSTRKTLNRFDNRYSKYIYKVNSVPKGVKEGIINLNNSWLRDMKDGNESYNYLLHNTVMCLEAEDFIKELQGAVIIYRDESDKLVAYDYFEVWGSVVYALGGKSIIKDLSPFKAVNRNVLYEANRLFGATVMDMGVANAFTERTMEPLDKVSLPLSDAKASLPHTKTMFNRYFFKKKLFNKVDLSSDSTNSLF